MKVRRFLAAWAVYVFITFVLGFVWHLVLFDELYRELAIFSRIDDPIVPLGFLAMLLQGAILAYLYPFLSRGRGPVIDGLIFGLTLGVLMASSAVIAEAAKQRVTSLPTWIVIESVYYLVQFGFSGIAIASVFGKTVRQPLTVAAPSG